MFSEFEDWNRNCQTIRVIDTYTIDKNGTKNHNIFINKETMDFPDYQSAG